MFPVSEYTAIFGGPVWTTPLNVVAAGGAGRLLKLQLVSKANQVGWSPDSHPIHAGRAGAKRNWLGKGNQSRRSADGNGEVASGAALDTGVRCVRRRSTSHQATSGPCGPVSEKRFSPLAPQLSCGGVADYSDRTGRFVRITPHKRRCIQPPRNLMSSTGGEPPDRARHAIPLTVCPHRINPEMIDRPRLKVIESYAEDCR